jgi:hypothetical protein
MFLKKLLILLLFASPALAGTSRSQIADSLVSSNLSVTLSLPTTTDTLVGRTSTDNLQNKSLFDTSVNFVNSADTTKKMAHSLSGMTTGTTLTLAGTQTTSQTLNIPNITATDTVATLKLSQTFTGTNTFSTPPTFSSLTTAGVLLNNSSGVVSSSAGALAIANGGTGATTQSGAANAVLPSQTSGYYLTSNGTTVSFAALRFAQETPSGNVNGSNTSFTLANTPLSGTSVLVHLDGALLTQTSDYTQSGTTLTFVSAPVLGQKIVVFYNY